MNGFLRVGVIANTHGIKGEVKVYPTTDDVQRFSELKNCILDTGKEQLPLTIQNVRYFKNLVIVKFKEFNNINEIERYKGKDLLIKREQAVSLTEDEYFIYDILGADVFLTDGSHFGELKEVLTTGANDVYVVAPDATHSDLGKEVLFPVIPQCVKTIDTDAKRVVVEIMPGLLNPEE